MKTAIVISAVIAIASTLISLSAAIKTLLAEYNRAQTEQRQLNEQVERVRQPDAPKVVTASPTTIHTNGLQLG
jgi:hypothetical protein